MSLLYGFQMRKVTEREKGKIIMNDEMQLLESEPAQCDTPLVSRRFKPMADLFGIKGRVGFTEEEVYRRRSEAMRGEAWQTAGAFAGLLP